MILDYEIFCGYLEVFIMVVEVGGVIVVKIVYFVCNCFEESRVV